MTIVLLQVTKFREIIGAIGTKTIEALANAGPSYQVCEFAYYSFIKSFPQQEKIAFYKWNKSISLMITS